MATQFEMPKLGLTMEFGTILNWLVDDGEVVAEGQPIMVIETDKVETEVESNGSGRFHAVAVVGETYDCGAHLGWFLDEGEEPPAAPEPAAAAGPSAESATPAAASAPAAVGADRTAADGVASVGVDGRILASPNAKRLAAERGIDLRSVTGSGPGGRIVSEDLPASGVPAGLSSAGAAAVGAAGAVASGGGGTGSAVPATIAARQLADLLGVDLALVPTGTDPRITREDVAKYVRGVLASVANAGAGGAAVGAPVPALLQTPTKTTALKGMRGTIAERMHTSLQQMAQLTLTMEVNMGAVAADRARRADGGTAPGYTDYVIAAAAAALREHPVVNSQVTEEGVAELPAVNVGMAVALDGGLIVPVVANTDALSLDDLAAETSRLAEAARSGGLTLGELEGGTFSVTALGMYGVDAFTPVINPPNTAILGVGRLRDGVEWADDGSPVRSKLLTLSLTWDHRAFDGVPAAEFTQSVKRHLESV